MEVQPNLLGPMTHSFLQILNYYQSYGPLSANQVFHLTLDRGIDIRD